MKVAILGPIVIDRITIDDTTKEQPGGIPYYTGNALAALGVDTELFVTYGKSEDAWFREHLPGVTITHIEAEKTLVGKAFFKSDDPDNRFGMEIEHVNNIIEPTDELLERLHSFDYIFLAPLFTDNTPVELFKRIYEEVPGKVVHGNFGMFTQPTDNKFTHDHPDNLIKALPYINYFILDDKEVMVGTAESSIESAVKKVLDNGVELLVVTRGSNGSTVYTTESTTEIPAYPPKVIADPTGAGDTYVAGFIYGLHTFKNIEQAGRFAAMTASISLENRGAFTGTKETILNRLV